MTDPALQPPDSSLAYRSPGLVSRDREHLRILSFFWYGWAAMCALVGSIFLVHIALGIASLNGVHIGYGSAEPGDPTGWIILIAGIIGFSSGWLCAFAAFLTARALRRHQRRTLCFVSALLSCLCIPFATILGILTLLVLARPSVRQSFLTPPS